MIQDMTQGKPLRQMVPFALPLMLSALIQMCYTLCDSLIIGRLLGERAFAGVNCAFALYWMPMSILLGFTQGAGVVFAQLFGAKNMPGLRRAFVMGALLIGLLAILLTVTGLLALLPFLRLLDTPEQLLPLAERYLRVCWAGLLLTAEYNACGALLRAAGDSRTPFVALIISTVANIALDFALIAGLGMGVEGAALATLMAQALSLLICMLTLRKATARLLPRGKEWIPSDSKSAREILRLGLPQMCSFGITAVGELFVQTKVNSFGVSFVTGFTASRRYFNLLGIIGFGMEGAVATFVGQNAGAKRYDRVIAGTGAAVRFSLICSLAITAFVLAFAPDMIRLFLPEAEAAVLQIGAQALRVEGLSIALLYTLCLYRASIQGVGNALIPMISGFTELSARLACVYILPALAGYAGLYFTDTVTWAVTSLLLIVSYAVIRKRTLRPLVLDVRAISAPPANE